MMLSALLTHVTDCGSVLDIQYYCDSVISGKFVCVCVCLLCMCMVCVCRLRVCVGACVCACLCVCESAHTYMCVRVCVYYSKHVWAHKGHGVYTMLLNTGKEAIFIKSSHYILHKLYDL